MTTHKKIGKRSLVAIIEMLNEGRTPIEIQEHFPMYSMEQIFVAARTAKFPYIKRDGKWYKCETE